METLIVVLVVLVGGIISGVTALSVPLYFKPLMRKRYERKHQRSKGNSRRLPL